MLLLSLILAAWLASSAPALAQEAPADEAIVRELIEVTAAAKLVDNVGSQVDSMIDIYRKSFTRKEIEGMLEFYRTDAGRAVIAKMPVVMQNTMTAMQEVQKDILARMRALDQQAKPQP